MGPHCARGWGRPAWPQPSILLLWGPVRLGRQEKGCARKRGGAAGLTATSCSLCVPSALSEVGSGVASSPPHCLLTLGPGTFCWPLGSPQGVSPGGGKEGLCLLPG